jgi:D-alanine-D-alanine ligase
MRNCIRPYRVAVVYNGSNDLAEDDDVDSLSERAVKQEADAIFNALHDLGHQPFYLELKDILSDLPSLLNSKPDIIFNLCEGYRGKASEEMNIAAIWQLLEIPFTGNSPLTLGLAQNKVLTKRLLISHKIPTPIYQVYDSVPQSTYLKYPLIAKPSREDASLGITQDSVAENFEVLTQTVQRLLEKYKQPILVEQLIDGREFNVSILGDNPPRVLPISEINFQDIEEGFHRITSYEAKWLEDHPLYESTPPVCPAQINTSLRQKLEDAAIATYKLLQGRDYGRVDFRVDPQENVYVLEYNPNPDISLDAGFTRALKAAKIDYPQFVEFLLDRSLNRIKNAQNQTA